MAKPPELTRDNEGAWKLAGSFSSGRYQFSVTPAAERLLRDELGYDEGDIVPWNCFRALVYAGDASLPSATDSPVETGDDLARPNGDVEMADAEASALAEHLQSKRFDERQREALSTHVETTESLVREGEASDGTPESDAGFSSPKSASTASDRRSATTVLHVSDSHLKPGGESDVDGVHGLDGFAKAVDVAVGAAVDAVVHTGNLFSSATPSDEVNAACRERLERLHRRDIPFFVVTGRNEVEDTDALDALTETAGVRRLGTTPTTIDESVALYGIDHRRDAGAWNGEIRLEDPEEHGPKLCCIHQAVSPPYSEYGADVEAYELAIEHIDGWVDAFLCGGTDRAVEWEGDDLCVYYTGTTDAARVRDDEDEPLVSLFTVRGESFERETIPLDGYDASERERERARSERENGRERKNGDERGGHPGSEMQSREATNPDVRPRIDAIGSLATMLGDAGTPDFEDRSTAELADMYALFSDVKGQVETLRTEVRDVLSSRVGEGEEVAGSFGSVSGRRRTRKSLKDAETVLTELARHGVSREDVVTERVDGTKVEDAIEERNLDINESRLYDISENDYVRRDDIDRDALRRRFEE
ncbi:metallophosphoesterase (plasmid) [Haladaptatus sp. SPP-AMP-3]|uniref:metallophosphoesterase n=1 Tax=Haladaptatus sp. SPP-AMP-3 TaxID=3121295 RepID=UPI003C2C65BF